MVRTCDHCAKSFTAKTSRARYCSGSCRALAAKRRTRDGVVAQMPSRQAVEPVLLSESVREALRQAGKSGWQARQAITLAAMLDNPMIAGAASLSKELDRVMGVLLADAAEADELDGFQADVIQMRSRRA